MKRGPRVLLAKGGLDGHTRPIRILAREFRDAGFEVVLTDMYQSPEEVCAQAIQEDPDIIAISIHTRGHIRFFSELFRLLKENGVYDDFVKAVGGVITEQDFPTLKEMGVDFISSPGDSIGGIIIPELRGLASNLNKTVPPGVELQRALCGGNTKALARFITLLTLGEVSLASVGEQPYVIGLSGNGGVGKSSLLGKLIEHLRPHHKLGVLCVDPTSSHKGAVLGDRIRFQTYELTCDPNVFIRSIAAHRPWRGVTRETPSIIQAMRDAGRDIILVESVGSGQRNARFNKVVGTFVYVTQPNVGDETQLLKGGAIETADIIALNKSDLDGELAAERALASIFGNKPRSDGWTVPIIQTVSSDEKDKVRGIEELWQAVKKHQQFLTDNSKRGNRNAV